MEYDIIRQLNGFVAAVSVPGRLEVLNSCLHCSPLYPMIVFTRSITPPGVCPSIPAAGCQHGLFSCVENAVGLSRSVDSLLNPFAVRRTPHSSSYSSRPPWSQRACGGPAGRAQSVYLYGSCLSVVLRLHAVQDDEQLRPWLIHRQRSATNVRHLLPPNHRRVGGHLPPHITLIFV